jgi:hypothetical protein
MSEMLGRSLLALPQLFAHLVRRTWLVAVVTVALCAALAAHAVAAYVEADYLAPPPQGRPILVAPSKAVATTQRKRPDATGLVERNMFCSSCGPIVESGPAGATYSGTPAILIATSVGPDALATVRVPSSEVQGSWGIGETIPGVGMVDRIGYTSIDVVDTSGRRGRISLLDAAAAGQAGAATLAAPAASPFGDRVHQIGENSYEVDRSLVKELVTGAMKPTGVRVLPAMANGEITGLRFAGVTSSSIPAAIGIKSGDVMSTLDGTQIKTAEALLDVYAKLDTLSQVEIGGTRGGKPLAIKLYLR